MVDEVECEYFSRKAGTSCVEKHQVILRDPRDLVVNDSTRTQDLLFYHMTRTLEQLEKQIFHKYKNFEDYKFVLERIKKAIMEKNMLHLINQLDDLEELLELEL